MHCNLTYIVQIVKFEYFLKQKEEDFFQSLFELHLKSIFLHTLGKISHCELHSRYASFV
jgi:hypothetical protein